MVNGWHIDGEVCHLKNCPQPHWSTREQAMVGKGKLDELEAGARKLQESQPHHALNDARHDRDLYEHFAPLVDVRRLA